MPEKKIVDEDENITIRKINSASIPNIYSQSLINFVKKLLTFDVNNRPTSRRAFAEAIVHYTFKYSKVTSINYTNVHMRTHTHEEALLSHFLAVNPVGLTEHNSEPANGFYVVSWCVFMTNCLQENIYTI